MRVELTESGVESLGGVGGNEKILWGWAGAVLGLWLLSGSPAPPPKGTQGPECPKGFADASESHGCNGGWKCGLQTWLDDILEAETIKKQPFIYRL